MNDSVGSIETEHSKTPQHRSSLPLTRHAVAVRVLGNLDCADSAGLLGRFPVLLRLLLAEEVLTVEDLAEREASNAAEKDLLLAVGLDVLGPSAELGELNRQRHDGYKQHTRRNEDRNDQGLSGATPVHETRCLLD